MKLRATLLGLVLVGSGLGCARNMTEADCTKVQDNLREAWLTAAKGAAPSDARGTEKAVSVIRSTGDRVAAEWAESCKRELVGRPVERKELTCVLDAKSLAELHKCMGP